MSDDRASTLERLTVAMKSSNMRLNLERRSDPDYLIALGTATRRQRASNEPTEAMGAEVAGMLMHLYIAGTTAACRSALESVQGLVAFLNEKHTWGLDAHQLRRVSEIGLAHHLAPVCPACNGQGFHLAPGTTRLSDRACEECKGTGRRPVPRRNRQEIRQLISVLEALDHTLEVAVKKYLRN